MKQPKQYISKVEFVVLLSIMISILALSIDIMLPALAEIAKDFNLANPNNAQLTLTFMFLGFAFGQLLLGPLSDHYGRKPVIYGGYLIFLLGCALIIFNSNFMVMLAGRLLQGIGASAPRIVGRCCPASCSPERRWCHR